jgi:methylglutaconyl-CoA hydratase
MVRVEDAGGVRTLTLDRPARRNALSWEMQDELIVRLREAGKDAECRVVVLAGEGEAFCAGLDLKAMLERVNAEGRDADAVAAGHVADAERVALMFRTLYECPKPTIAAVHGAAIAGGTGLAMICDFTLAAPEARFGFTEIRIGFVPALVSAYLCLQVGEKRARDLLLTGRMFTAEEAFRVGLVTEVAPRGSLAERTKSLTEMLIENSPESLRATKALLAAQNKAWLDAAVEEALAAHAKSRLTADFREGVAAFVEKRKPVWRKN